MKIIYIANVKLPTVKAHGIQIVKMCEAFSKLGIDIELVIPKRKIDKDIYYFYDVNKNFSIKRLPIFNLYNIGYLGFILSSISFSISSLVYVLFKKGDFIVYSRDQDQFSFFTIPFMKRVYFFEIHSPKRRDLFHRLLFKKVTGVIATTDLTKGRLQTTFKNIDEKILVCQNGVDINKYKVVEIFDTVEKDKVRNEFMIPEDKKVILYVGHFYEWKDVDLLIAISSNLSNDTVVYLVGGQEKDINRLKEKYNIDLDKVKFIGPVYYREIPSWYKAADILVLTGTKKNDYSANYTSPIKLFEYMASRTPILAVNTPSVKNIVSKEEVKFYESGNAESMLDSINDIFSKPNEAQNRVEKAYMKVRNYTWEKRAKKIIEFINIRLNISENV